MLLKRRLEGEKVPKDWQMSVILPIFKKCNSKDCNNYRGPTNCKKRLRRQIKPFFGFQAGRSIQDHILTVK